MSGDTVRRGWRTLRTQLRRLVAPTQQAMPVHRHRSGDVADWLRPYRIPDGDVVTGSGWEAP
jgi:hypothetical protein